MMVTFVAGMGALSHRRATFLAGVFLLAPYTVGAETVAVRYAEGLVHGFLGLRTLEGKALADGELIQVARGDRVTARLVFRFRDGSLSDETSVFTQRRQFRLLSNHLIQKGPAFDKPMEANIDATSGQVAVRYSDDGKEKRESERMKLPVDLANGILLTLLKNLDPKSGPTTVSMLAITPKPRLVKLHIERMAEEGFTFGSASRKATRYNVKVDIGGIAGIVAPLLNKVPPDSSVWILGGDAPAFVRSEAPLFSGGPLWRIELLSPVWPK